MTSPGHDSPIWGKNHKTHLATYLPSKKCVNSVHVQHVVNTEDNPAGSQPHTRGACRAEIPQTAEWNFAWAHAEKLSKKSGPAGTVDLALISDKSREGPLGGCIRLNNMSLSSEKNRRGRVGGVWQGHAGDKSLILSVDSSGLEHRNFSEDSEGRRRTVKNSLLWALQKSTVLVSEV